LQRLESVFPAKTSGMETVNDADYHRSRKGKPNGNSKAESFMKTLGYEEVLINDCNDLFEANERVGRFLEQIYNEQRVHYAFGYISPMGSNNKPRQPATR
jgi:putative transposase